MPVYYIVKFLFSKYLIPGIVLTLLALLTLHLLKQKAHPAPLPITNKKPVEKQKFLIPSGNETGTWIMIWGSYSSKLELAKYPKDYKAEKMLAKPENTDFVVGTYKWDGWKGSYAWSPSQRMFTVVETCDDWKTHYHWWSVLDKDGNGVAEGAFKDTIFKVTEVPKAEKLKFPKGED
jgi:hypothetical protein